MSAGAAAPVLLRLNLSQTVKLAINLLIQDGKEKTVYSRSVLTQGEASRPPNQSETRWRGMKPVRTLQQLSWSGAALDRAQFILLS